MNYFSSENVISLLTLSALEIVLGIDNIVFIAILAQKAPAKDRARVRRLGLVLALLTRLGLLATLSFIMGLTKPLFTLLGQEMSGRGLVLLVGGLFLIGKSTHEIYDKLEGDDHEEANPAGGARNRIAGILIQIMLLDVVFSLDSVITAVGMAQHIWIMVVAMILAVAVMLAFATAVSEFINRHPSMKILALSFLLMIGVLLVAEAFDKHVNKGYIYFAMAFSLTVEILNIRLRKKQRPVALHAKYHEEATRESTSGASSSGSSPGSSPSM